MKSVGLRILVILCGFCLLQAQPPVQADDLVDSLLTDAEVKELLPEAQKEYLLAQALLDQILISEAMDHLEKAAELDQKHVPLQFLTARTAIQLARNGNGNSFALSLENSKTDAELANEYYAVASQCIKRIKSITQLPEMIMTRAKNIERQLQEEKSSIAEREARRQIASDRFLMENAEEKYRDAAVDNTENPQQAASGITVLGVPSNMELTIANQRQNAQNPQNMQNNRTLTNPNAASNYFGSPNGGGGRVVER